MRVVKAPDVRRSEILAAANQLFQTQGYSRTSVDQIVNKVRIAKGTFYHYFKSKEQILDALADQLVLDMAYHSEQIANHTQLNAIEKIVTIISEQNRLQSEQQNVVDSMHLPDNRQLHERINIKIVLTFGPILATVIEQGNQQGLFDVKDPLSTIQFILAGSLFLFGEGVFNWPPEQAQARIQSMIILIERTFGAQPGSMIIALNQCLNEEKQ